MDDTDVVLSGVELGNLIETINAYTGRVGARTYNPMKEAVPIQFIVSIKNRQKEAREACNKMFGHLSVYQKIADRGDAVALMMMLHRIMELGEQYSTIEFLQVAMKQDHASRVFHALFHRCQGTTDLLEWPDHVHKAFKCLDENGLGRVDFVTVQSKFGKVQGERAYGLEPEAIECANEIFDIAATHMLLV